MLCPTPLDPTIQSSAAFVFHAMAIYSLDTARNFSSDFLPLVFLAMHAKPQEEDDGEEGEERRRRGRGGEGRPS